MKHILALILAATMLLSAIGLAGNDFDYTKYPDILMETYGQKTIDNAVRVIDAFFAGESSIVLDDYAPGDLAGVCRCISVMCPVFFGFALIGDECIDNETGEFFWISCCEADELAGYRARFEQAAEGYLSPVAGIDNELIIAADIYYRFISDCVYDYYPNDFKDYEDWTTAEKAYVDSSYAAMVDNLSICYGFSEALTFLYIQAGLNAVTVGCFDSDTGNGAHAWVMVEIDGIWYYADPTWDIPDLSEIPGLRYFGMTADDRYDAGAYPLYLSYICINNFDSDVSAYGLNDTRFSYLRDDSFIDVVSLTPDAENGCLIAVTAEGAEYIIE